MAKKTGLIYIGNAALIGVPARDLTPDEVEKHGRDLLINSGLYVEPEPKKPAEPKPKKTEA